MKITKQISLLLALLLTAVSCDQVDEFTQIDITDDFTATINIAITEDSEGMPVSFTETATINITSNQDIQDNVDTIQNIAVNALTYEISNFDGAAGATVTEASLSFGNTAIAISNINLQEADTNNTAFPITGANLLNTIADQLENNSTILVTLSGTINETPVVFDVIVTLDVTVTAELL